MNMIMQSSFWGAHAPSRANFGALAEILVANTQRLARAPLATRLFCAT